MITWIKTKPSPDRASWDRPCALITEFVLSSFHRKSGLCSLLRQTQLLQTFPWPVIRAHGHFPTPYWDPVWLGPVWALHMLSLALSVTGRAYFTRSLWLKPLQSFESVPRGATSVFKVCGAVTRSWGCWDMNSVNSKRRTLHILDLLISSVISIFMFSFWKFCIVCSVFCGSIFLLTACIVFKKWAEPF